MSRRVPSQLYAPTHNVDAGIQKPCRTVFDATLGAGELSQARLEMIVSLT